MNDVSAFTDSDANLVSAIQIAGDAESNDLTLTNGLKFLV